MVKVWKHRTERMQVRMKSLERCLRVKVIWWWSTFDRCAIWLLKVVLPEAWRSAMIVQLYKGKGERNECKN